MDNVKRKGQGLPYRYDDPALLGDQHIYQCKMIEYNQTLPTETEKRQKLLKEVFAEVGSNCTVETPLNANWGCKNAHLGEGIYISSNVTFVDDEQIYIGDYSMISPNVVFTTSGHPVLPILRENHYVYNLPIHIGRNVWIGSNVSVMPGVSIGDNTVIGAGSVVTNDIPANVVAFGVPCRVIREIGERDREYYYKDRKLDVWE